ncbi:hypothetical protein KOR34_02270 [Posidoniimonas corsicana]|uniref:Uncharacterized protein n=2 Tax=Posidoniimonas corsicana TaxID=1938618 RepID=A0A5C5VBJ2_9BACT|nr:hypothetical protein KOR34_02270 [Posidoniimonas corsicana]
MGAALLMVAPLLLVAAPSQACGPVAGGGAVFSFSAPQAVYAQPFVQQQVVHRQAFVQPQALILPNRVHRRPVAFAPVRRGVAAAHGAVRGFARGY